MSTCSRFDPRSHGRNPNASSGARAVVAAGPLVTERIGSDDDGQGITNEDGGAVSASKQALWQQISTLLAEHERAQTDAVRRAVAETWENLRTKLQVLAITDEPANDDEAG